jgi:hypothetical protein
VLFAAVLAVVAFQLPGSSQTFGRPGDDASLTFTTGQGVAPVYHGWLENPDGTFDLYFSYINRNWQEKLTIPVGPNNNISAPFGPDAGQPTFFYPRINRWQFSVRVPKDFGAKEVVWTVTANGQTNRAYGTLNPGYQVDEFLMQHEFGNSQRGRRPPTLKVDGAKQITVKVGQPVQLVATATPSPDMQAARGGGGGGRGSGSERLPGEVQPGGVGGDFVRGTARGLLFAWLVYRGTDDGVTIDPPIPFRVWEDQRGGTPWSPNFRVPTPPPGNKWVHNVTFAKPGTYVLRGQVHDGFQFARDNVTITVTQ